MATDLQYREGLTDTQKNQLVTRLDRINAGSAITDTDKSNFNYGLGSSWQSYLSPSVNYNDLGKANVPVAPPVPPQNDGSNLMAGLNAQNQQQQVQLTADQQKLQEYQKQFQDIQMLQGVNKAETAYDTSVQGLQDLQSKEMKKTQALAEAYKTGGVEQYQKRLAELNQQAAQLQGSYLRGLTDVEGKVIPMGFITGQQAQMQKQYATQAASVALEQQALQGNIENAKSIAKDMVDLEYGDIEKQIAYQKDLINLNYDNLTRTEKKRADEMNYILDQRQKAIDEEKANKTAIQNTYIDAINSGITDKKVLNSILNSVTPEAALRIAGPYIGKTKQELNDLDVMYKKAQIMNIQSEIANRGAEAANYDPASILAYAQQYASNGSIPTGLPKGSFGLVSQIAKELPKVNGEIVDNNTGIKSSKLTATQLDAYSAMKDLVNKTEEAKQLFSKLNTGLIGGTLGNVFKTQTRQQYNILRGEIVDLLSRARSGAALTANEEANYLKKIPGTFNQTLWMGSSGENKLEGLKKSLEGKLDTGLKANGISMYGFSKVKVGDEEFTVGDIISNGTQQARVNPDGTLTLITQ